MAFNGDMLCLARQIRKVSQSDLIDMLDGAINQSMLSKIERGRVQPSDELVHLFAKKLKFRTSFFFNAEYVRQPPISYHRKRKKLLARDLSAIHGISEMLRISLSKCLNSIDLEHDGPSLPVYDLDQFDGDPKEAARAVRARLKLARGPIRDVSKVIEDSGVIIVPFNFGTTLIDGFCQHSYGSLPSLIFINTQLPVDRLRFSLCHELAHLVCHDVPNPEQEIQADQFASEFLMPTDDIRDDLRDFSLNKAMELKLHWGTSMQSLTFKAWEIGKISDKRKQNCFIEMSRRGWRKNEPIEARGFVERAATFSKILKAHTNELGYSQDELSDLFGIPEEDMRFYFPIERSRPALRIVASN